MMEMKKLLTAICFTAFAPVAFAAANLTDAEIAKIVETANDAEIKAGQVAESKGKSPEIKAYAKDMVKMHKENNKEAKKWAKGAKVKPKESDMSRELSDDAKTKMTTLSKANAKDFDRAYIQSQVEMHEKVLNSINNDLLPNAQNPELKAMLEKTRPVVEQHLAHARQLQSSMPAEPTTTK